MRTLGVVVGAIALGFLPSAGLADGTTVVGSVGPGFSISLRDSSGAPVRNLDPGAYSVQVHDQATVHSFHLVGPGVDQATEIETISDPVWAVTLAAGTYTFYCDAHPEQLRGPSRSEPRLLRLRRRRHLRLPCRSSRARSGRARRSP